MLSRRFVRPVVVAALTQAALMGAAHAAIIITEVHPSGSGNAPYQADFFEITNTGPAAVSLVGWRIDDNSNSFAASVALRGVSSIDAGQSIVFVETNAAGSNDASVFAAFRTAWFGSNVPAGFTIGSYGGSGVGLSTGGDAVNIFNASGTVIHRVDFGPSTTNVTFDNAAGTSGLISQLSVVGVNGAFQSAGSPREVGSPGVIPAPTAASLVAMGLAGLSRRSRRAR